METSVSGSAAVSHGNVDDRDYDAFLERLNARILERTNDFKRPLFKTDAPDLFKPYLDLFSDEETRQYHNCHACRRFLELYGSLAVVDDDGRLQSALWDPEDAPPILAAAITMFEKAVRRARIETVFLTSEKVWGQPVTGPWKHMAITNTPRRESWPSYARALWSGVSQAEQIMAEKREDFRTVSRALAEFNLDILEQVVQLLRSDQLYRSDKVLGPAEWLRDVQRQRTAARGNARENVVWKAVATAPAGFCHPRSSMIGTLLADISSGLSFHEVSARFRERMAPSQYQRPQAAPKAGAIERAERLVDTLGIEPSLRRRHLRLDEVAPENVLWKPREAAQRKAGGVFGHLLGLSERNRAAQFITPQITMTWSKFQTEVLATAEQLEMRAPHRGPYCAFVTAADMDAPPILQWDREDARNPVSWYFEDKGAFASRFNVSANMLCKVTAVMLKPTMWQPGFDHFGKGVMLVIDGARDTERAGLALFPEMLKSELHGVRSVIEAHSKSREMEGGDQPNVVAGLMIEAGCTWGLPLRVHTNGRHQDYVLDRWD